MTLEKVRKIVDDICWSVEECSDCPFNVDTNGGTVCAFDKVYDVIKIEVEKERGFCRVVLPTSRNTLLLYEEDMDAVMEEITDYKRRKEMKDDTRKSFTDNRK